VESENDRGENARGIREGLKGGFQKKSGAYGAKILQRTGETNAERVANYPS